MKTLEEDIDVLTELDAWRIKAAQLRDEGRNALARSLRGPEEKRRWARTTAKVIETSLVLKALLAHRVRPVAYPASLVRDLENVSLESVMGSDPDGVPVLRAAKAMCALAGAPSSAFSPSMMFLYYSIIREIYVADAPEWSTGGARAGEGMSPKAYVTWQCIRGILAFQRTLEHTATLIGGIAAIIEQSEKRVVETLPAWQSVDAKRLRLEFATTLQTLRDNVALKVAVFDDEQSAFETARFAKRFRSQLRSEIARCDKDFRRAAAEIRERHGKLERSLDSSDKKKLTRLATAHEIALEAVDDAVARGRTAIELLKTPDPIAKQLRRLEKEFAGAAQETRKILHPATNYVLRVLNRELASAAMSSSNVAWDPAEMAFAAVAYGESTQLWSDDRLERAGEHLKRVLSERGRFPTGRPIHTSGRGYQLHPMNSDVLRAFAILLQNVQSVDVDAAIVKRMMGYFEDTQSKTRPGTWHREAVQGQQPPERSVTAAAVLALDSINEMLDARINAMVFRHFSTKKVEDIRSGKLPDLFYSDYGMVAANGKGVTRDDSVAVVLERMRAHVCGLPAAGFKTEKLFSAVLYGPAGTGKTTLVEALAASCGVTLVEVTPSDIVIGGADAIERRTRAVFKALSLLTRAVILFDEFDPVLLRRTFDEKNPTVFSFLTPGMLPKLKSLHDWAEKRSVAYVLITNLIGKLDDAAIRNGRFDIRLGIYPPDFLSRAGRLYRAMAEFESHPRKGLSRPGRLAVREVVCATAGAPMNTLGKRGWFTAPEGVEASSKNAFGRLYGACDALPDLQAEAKFDPDRVPNGPDAEREYREWLWVRTWDEEARACRSLTEGLNKAPTDAQMRKKLDRYEWAKEASVRL
jgi:hypothetical protein